MKPILISFCAWAAPAAVRPAATSAATTAMRNFMRCSSSRRSISAAGELQVGVHQLVDEHADHRLVEAGLAGVGGGAQRVGLDLDHGDAANRRHAARAPGDAVGE